MEKDLVWKQFERNDSEISQMWVWKTECERYLICRSSAFSDKSIRIVSCRVNKKGIQSWIEFDKKLGNGYPREYKRLEDAFISVEIYHKEKYDFDSVSTNREEILFSCNNDKVFQDKKILPVEREFIPKEVNQINDIEKPKKEIQKRDYSSTEKDKYGCKLGSQASQINLTLKVDKPQTVKEIAKILNLTEVRVNNHFRAHLGDKGFIEKEGDGYKLKY